MDKLKLKDNNTVGIRYKEEDFPEGIEPGKSRLSSEKALPRNASKQYHQL